MLQIRGKRRASGGRTLYTEGSVDWESVAFKTWFAVLVLSRKANEAIVIGENIVVTVIDIRGDKIRLGVEAPKHVSVHRQEVYQRIKPSDTEDQPPQDQATPDIRPN